MSNQKIYYYRIFDDKDETVFIRTNIDYNNIKCILAEFEKNHDEYLNEEFMAFLKKHDNDAEIFDVINLYY